MKLKIYIVLTALSLMITQSSCGLISVIGSPTRHEIKITAEFNLAKQNDKKILVLVEEDALLNANINLRYYLTESINKNLTEKAGILPEYLIGYSKLSEFRSGNPDFSKLSPTEAGTFLEADFVLLIIIKNYKISELPEADYFTGLLNAQAVLFDAVTKEKIWPEEMSKSIKAGFDIEKSGRDIAENRLITATAHCIIRYLYDCPKSAFKIADDKGRVGWNDWKN